MDRHACQKGVTTLVLLLLAVPLYAQDTPILPTGDDVAVRLGATLQGRFSAGHALLGNDRDRTRLGFGLRRARLRMHADLFERVGLYLQLDGAGSAVDITDAHAFYRLSDGLQVRLGRVAPAQPRSFNLTSHKAIDAVDRAAIAELWGTNTIGSSGRDFGLDLEYATDRTAVIAGIYNGDGSWSRARGNYRESISGGAPTGGVDQTGLAFSLYGSHQIAALGGLEIGGHASYNASENPNTIGLDAGRSYASYSAHAYWGATPGSQPIRLKADVVGVVFEEVPSVSLDGALDAGGRQQTLGASLLGAVRVHPSSELFVRAEQYTPNTHRSDLEASYVTTGISFSPSVLLGGPYSKVRLTAAYSGLFPGAEDRENQHLGVVQAQLVF